MKDKGFTLVELLIVIAIISVLSAVIFPNFMTARERARDAQRKSDLQQIQKALELYKMDKADSSYPTTIPWGLLWTKEGDSSVVYMSKVPTDPLYGQDANYVYTYTYSAANRSEYSLCSCLENNADSDTLHVVDCSTSGCSNCGGKATKCYLINYK